MTGSKEGEVTPQSRYAAATEIWRFFAAWREKIIAGYLAVLAGLAAGFGHYSSPDLRCAMLAAAIVASFVFWVFDVRNVYFLNVTQEAASQLEGGDGCFSALQTRLDPAKSIRASILAPTYAQAINLLVASVVAGAAGGLYVLLTRVAGHSFLAAAAVASIIALLLILSFAYVRTWAWEGEKERRAAAKNKA